MADVSWSDTAASAPPPSSPPSYTPGGNAWGQSQSAFQQALQQADPGAHEPDDVDHADESSDETEGSGDDDGGGKKDKGVGSGGLLADLAGALGLPGGVHGRGLGKGLTDGKQDALGALDGRAGSAVLAPPTQAGGDVDLDAFADMLEQVAARADLTPNQSFQVTLGDASLPVTSIAMTRLPDGSLSMTLGADNEAVTEVRGVLDALRRRLQAKGVAMGELKLQAEINPVVEQAESA